MFLIMASYTECKISCFPLNLSYVLLVHVAYIALRVKGTKGFVHRQVGVFMYVTVLVDLYKITRCTW